MKTETFREKLKKMNVMDNHKKPDVISNFQDSGFTFIEVIIAISVMVIGIVGTLLAVQYAISSTAQSYSRLTAAYLAQEGIEIVRAARDGNWLEQRTATTTSWDEDLGAGDYEVDYRASQDEDPSSPSWYPLTCSPNCGYSDLSFLGLDSNGFYSRTYSPGTETQFKRMITIEKPATTTLKVISKVYWAEGKHSIIAQENLYNWRSDH